jgi:hypothetical protein
MLAGREAPLFLCPFESVRKLNYEKVETAVLHEIKNTRILQEALMLRRNIMKASSKGEAIGTSPAFTMMKESQELRLRSVRDS